MKINPNTNQAYKLIHNGILALSRAEQQGFRVDVDYIEEKKAELTDEIKETEEKLKDTNFYKRWEHVSKKVNIYSTKQLQYYLYNVRKIKPLKLTATEQGSTDDEALAGLNIPELNMILELRNLKKIRDTYLESIAREQVNGRIHPFYNLHNVRTHRSSSNAPNFQNLPKRDERAMQIVRGAIYPREGHQLVEIDYGSLEVRIAACYHQDPKMLQYIKDPKTDMHGDMAKQIFKVDDFNKDIPEHSKLRYSAKNGFVFPQFYGDYYGNCAEYMACKHGELPKGRWKSGQGIPMPEGTLSDHLILKGIKSYKQFEKHIEEIEDHFWNVRFPKYKKWKDRWWKIYQKRGYVDLLTGFRCSGVMDKKDVTNYPVQGAAFHCLLWSFIELDRIMRTESWDTKLIGQIHDSIILDVLPEELDHVIKTARHITTEKLPETWTWINVPLEVDVEINKINASWAEKS